MRPHGQLGDVGEFVLKLAMVGYKLEYDSALGVFALETQPRHEFVLLKGVRVSV